MSPNVLPTRSWVELQPHDVLLFDTSELVVIALNVPQSHLHIQRVLPCLSFSVL